MFLLSRKLQFPKRHHYCPAAAHCASLSVQLLLWEMLPLQEVHIAQLSRWVQVCQGASRS